MNSMQNWWLKSETTVFRNNNGCHGSSCRVGTYNRQPASVTSEWVDADFAGMSGDFDGPVTMRPHGDHKDRTASGLSNFSKSQSRWPFSSRLSVGRFNAWTLTFSSFNSLQTPSLITPLQITGQRRTEVLVPQLVVLPTSGDRVSTRWTADTRHAKYIAAIQLLIERYWCSAGSPQTRLKLAWQKTYFPCSGRHFPWETATVALCTWKKASGNVEFVDHAAQVSISC